MKRKKILLGLSILTVFLMGSIVYAQNIIPIKLQGVYNEEHESAYWEWVYGAYDEDIYGEGGNLTSEELNGFLDAHPQGLPSGCVCLPWNGTCGDGGGEVTLSSPFGAYGYPYECYGGGDGDS